MATMTMGQHMLAKLLPPDAYQPGEVIDKKSINRILGTVAEKYPERYKETLSQLVSFGKDTAKSLGGGSFGVSDLATPPQAAARRQELEAQIRNILETVPPALRAKAIIQAVSAVQKDDASKLVAELEQQGNPLADILKGAGRGNPAALARLVASDLLYADANGDPVPIPILRSYSQGLSTGEYAASSFGARKGVVEAKVSVTAGGYSAKQTLAAAHRMVVTDDDGPEPDTIRGLPVDTGDEDNLGALLAADTGPYKRNTEITPKIAADLIKKGYDQILVRSPLTTADPMGGVYAKDIGYRAGHKLPRVGDSVGILAASMLNEQVVQSVLCLDVNELVRMADGSVLPISRIKPGDRVLGCDLAGHITPCKVLGSSSSGRKPCVTAYYRQGKSTKNFLQVTGSPDHKILTDVTNSYATADCEATLNGFGVMPRPLSHRPTKKSRVVSARLSCSFDDAGMVAEPRALLLGLLLGDGTLTGVGNRIKFSCYEPDMAEEVADYLASLGYDLKPTTTEGEFRVNDTDSRYMKHDVDGKYRHRLIRWLKSLGVWGCDAHGKHVPKDVWNWDNPSVAKLIAGLWLTDGCVSTSNNTAIFSSSSLPLITAVRALLWLRFGVRSSTPYPGRKERPSGGQYLPCYQIVVGGKHSLERMAGSIPVTGRKGLALQQVAARVVRQRGNPDRATRVAVVEVGERDTWDIHIDHPDHLFVLASGLIVSNSAKHKGGIATHTEGLTGFALIDKLLNPPKDFRDAAAYADVDGRIQEIRDAPQGGKYVTISGQRHYVPAGKELLAKLGDTVEAGDKLSEGPLNPHKVIEHKGLGEGARQLTFELRKALKDSNLYVNRRNVEPIVRGLVNRVELTEEYGDYLPGDVVPYNELANAYYPRDGAKETDLSSVVGRYLEKPVLHYSIGTRVTPKVVEQLRKFGVDRPITHEAPPPFKSTAVRAIDILKTDSDWMTQQIGTGLEKSLLTATHRSAVSDEAGSSFVAARARMTDFNRVGVVKNSPSSVLYRQPTPTPSGLLRIPPKPGQPQP